MTFGFKNLCMKFLQLSLLVAMFAACQPQEAAKTTAVDGSKAIADTLNYTTIQWMDSVQNIGTLTMGQNPTINFRFKNTGDKNLFIVSAQPGCGCTIADYPKEPILPGKEGVIKAGFDTKGQSVGAFHKGITVITNTLVNVNHNLIFSGEIKKDGDSNAGLDRQPVAVPNDSAH